MKMNVFEFQRLINSATGNLELGFNNSGDVFVNDRATDNALLSSSAKCNGFKRSAV